MTQRWSMLCRLGVREGTFGTRQSLVDSTEHPQHEGVPDLSGGAGISAEPVGESAMAFRVVEIQGGLKMLMGADKVAQIKAGDTGSAVRDQGLGTIRQSRGFAQEKLC